MVTHVTFPHLAKLNDFALVRPIDDERAGEFRQLLRLRLIFEETLQGVQLDSGGVAVQWGFAVDLGEDAVAREDGLWIRRIRLAFDHVF